MRRNDGVWDRLLPAGTLFWFVLRCSRRVGGWSLSFFSAGLTFPNLSTSVFSSPKRAANRFADDMFIKEEEKKKIAWRTPCLYIFLGKHKPRVHVSWGVFIFMQTRMMIFWNSCQCLVGKKKKKKQHEPNNPSLSLSLSFFLFHSFCTHLTVSGVKSIPLFSD